MVNLTSFQIHFSINFLGYLTLGGLMGGSAQNFPLGTFNIAIILTLFFSVHHPFWGAQGQGFQPPLGGNFQLGETPF